MKLYAKALLWALMTIFLVVGAKAHDPQHPEWDKWFSNAPVTDEAYPRLAAAGHVWKTCCGKGDRVKAQFRVSANKPYTDEWHYRDPTTNQWVKIPNDIIHYKDDPTMPTQLKVEGVLFVYNGLPTCFWAPQEGG